MALLSSMTSLIAETTVNTYMTFPWAMLLNGAFGGIAFYALRIILLTVIIKIVLSPLDYYQRYKMRKNQLISLRVKPQMEKLEKAYGSNPKVLQQKQAELNRREGMSYMSSCLPMIVTLVIFIWLWQALLATANFKQFDNYAKIYDIYEVSYESAYVGNYDAVNGTLSDEFGKDFHLDYDAAFAEEYGNSSDVNGAAAQALASSRAKMQDTAYADLYATTYSDWFAETYTIYAADESKTAEEIAALAQSYGAEKAKQAVVQYCETIAQNEVFDYYEHTGKYDDKTGYQHDSFLWIHDIWSPDVPWTNSLKKTQAEFTSAIGSYATDAERSGIEQDKLDKMVSSYETVMARVINETSEGPNGFLILPVLAVVLNVLMQIITRRQQKKSGQDQTAGQSAGCMKGMLFIMPIIMGIFAIMYCAAFTIYMVTNSAMSLLINLITSAISKKVVPINETAAMMSTRKSKKGELSDVERYGRPDPNSDDKKKK